MIKRARARVAELVDAPDLRSGAVRCKGSSPFLGKTHLFIALREQCY